jgi:hypothetical protein
VTDEQHVSENERQPTIVALIQVDGEGIEPWSQWSLKGPGYDFVLPPSWPPAKLSINGKPQFEIGVVWP